MFPPQYAGALFMVTAGQLEADVRPYLVHTSVMRWRMASMDNDEIFRADPSSGPLVLDLFDDVPMRAQENPQRRTLRR